MTQIPFLFFVKIDIFIFKTLCFKIYSASDTIRK